MAEKVIPCTQWANLIGGAVKLLHGADRVVHATKETIVTCRHPPFRSRNTCAAVERRSILLGHVSSYLIFPVHRTEWKATDLLCCIVRDKSTQVCAEKLNPFFRLSECMVTQQWLQHGALHITHTRFAYQKSWSHHKHARASRRVRWLPCQSPY